MSQSNSDLLLHTCVDRYLEPEPTPMLRPDGAPELALVTNRMWDCGRVLDFHFLSGSEAQKQNVRSAALAWSKHANLIMRFDAPLDGAEFRVAFDPVGNWSYIGLDCLGIASPKATMNIQQDSSALHEVGHALGCLHEHSQPNSAIQWNKPVVYQALGGPPNNWSPEKVDFNVFKKYSATETQFSAFDPNSIMLYSFPASWTLNGVGTHANSTLSGTDTAFIRRCYPGCTVDFSKPTIATGGCTVSYGPRVLFNQTYGNSWIMNQSNASFIEVRFNQPKQYNNQNIYSAAKLKLNHLTSMNGPKAGSSPIDIIFNGTKIKSDYSPPSGNYLLDTFDVMSLMKDGENVVRLNFKSAVTNYWINKLQVDCERILY